MYFNFVLRSTDGQISKVLKPVHQLFSWLILSTRLSIDGPSTSESTSTSTKTLSSSLASSSSSSSAALPSPASGSTLEPLSCIQCRQKTRRVRTQLYGYVLTHDWINDFATRKQIGTPGHYLDTSSSVVFHILRETRFRRAYAVKWEDSIALCIAVAHNKSAEGLKLATSERIERLKRVMEVEEDPCWFDAA